MKNVWIDEAGRSREPSALLEPLASEQAPQAGQRGVGELAPLADDCPVVPPEDQLSASKS